MTDQSEPTVTVSFTIQEAHELAEAARAGLGHAYVSSNIVLGAANRLDKAAISTSE